jgi:acetolactate synthase-1/3 small subunit
MPVGDETRSVVLLLVHEDDRIEQVVRQLRKLEDVVEVGPMPGGHDAFDSVAGYLV